jgi:tetratricopeptide (TPR) repeat protein
LAEETLLLCRENGDRFHEAELLDNILGDAAIRQGDYAQAIVLREHGLELRRALHDIDGQAWSLFMLAGTVRMLGDMPRAQTLYEESTALWRQLGSRRWYADVLDELGRVNCNQGNYSRAKALFEESLTSAQSIYDQYRASRAMCDLATVACLTDDHPQAQTLLKTVSRSIWELLDSPLLAIFLISEARLASATHLLERAACMAGAAQSALKKVPPYPGTSDLMEYEAVVSLIRPALSQEEFARAYAEGQAMSFETALAL